MDTWNSIEAIDGRASKMVCEWQEAPFDYRPYGTALSHEGYPHIAAWAQGDWTEAGQQECLQLWRTAIARGSRPMLRVVRLALQNYPLVKQILWKQLTPTEQARTKVLLAME